MSACGVVAWAAEGRCGVSFSGSVDVPPWRLAIAGGDEQKRVGDVVTLVKSNGVPGRVRPSLPASSSSGPAPLAQVADDLRTTAALLQSLASQLADDAAVLDKHGAQLQDIDIAMRFVATIAARLSKCERESARFKLDGLRSSALQALATYG